MVDVWRGSKRLDGRVVVPGGDASVTGIKGLAVPAGQGGTEVASDEAAAARKAGMAVGGRRMR